MSNTEYEPLKVPLIKQKEGTMECGIAGIAMVLKYYGLDIDYEVIRKDLDVDNVGTYAPQLGDYLLKHNIENEIITFHPLLFHKGIKEKMITDSFYFKSLKQYYGKILKKDMIEQRNKEIDYFIEYLDNGGKIIPKIPDEEDIIREINNKNPLGAFMTTAFLFNNIHFNFHFNLITGINEGKVYVNDPAYDFTGGYQVHDIKDFLYGMYASLYYGLDNGCLLTFGNKNK